MLLFFLFNALNVNSEKVFGIAEIEDQIYNNRDMNLLSLFEKIAENSLPKEKVYLHLDNTSYYHGDNIWFSAYLVNSDGNTSDAVSKTLYVELLNPGGDIIDKRVLEIVDGRAHGSFKINNIPFYSGFYEIRAYTKYMMNFRPETAFSRVLPVFDSPQKAGDYQQRKMLTYGSGKYTYTRKRPKNGNDIDICFYPEGGRMLKGIPTKISFEARDKKGYPIDLEGTVFTAGQDTVISFRTMHEGKGFFTIIPDGATLCAMVEHNGKAKKVKLPEIHSEGFSLSVDNLSNSDSIIVTVNRAGLFNRIDTVGLILSSHGIMKMYSAVSSSFRKPLQFAFNKRNLSPGIAEITLVDIEGQKIADRMIFIMPDSTNSIDLQCSFDKKSYNPYELINMSVSVADAEGNPIKAPFSISVRDRKDEIAWNRDIRTDLLLMSDIKGYVANPTYYFESDDSLHRHDLDLLMMVQGWRKYPWESFAWNDKNMVRFKPETEGIEIEGTVRSFTNKKMSDVDVTAFLMKSDVDDSKSIPAIDMTKTDSLGRFSFYVDIYDHWKLILNTTKKNKLIDSQISLDKGHIPQPRQYKPYEMETHQESFNNNSYEASINKIITNFDTTTEDNPLKSNNSENDKSVWLEEVMVTHKKNWLDDARAESRKRSVAYYDVDDEINNLRDNGEYIDVECDIHKLIMKLNPKFTKEYYYGYEQLIYKHKLPLVIVDFERLTGGTPDEYYKYKDTRIESIKSISISEDNYLKGKYCWDMIPPSIAESMYSCVIMIETYPDGKVMVDGGKGIRKTSIHGYDSPQEFYSPDYSVMQPEEDYRRTLYWNPEVIPDDNGKATIKFYNNSNCQDFKVDMQTVTRDGIFGVSR